MFLARGGVLLCSSVWLATGTALSARRGERWRETFSSLHKSTRFSRRCDVLIRSEAFRGSDPDGIPVAEFKGLENTFVIADLNTQNSETGTTQTLGGDFQIVWQQFCFDFYSTLFKHHFWLEIPVCWRKVVFSQLRSEMGMCCTRMHDLLKKPPIYRLPSPCVCSCDRVLRQKQNLLREEILFVLKNIITTRFFFFITE